MKKIGLLTMVTREKYNYGGVLQEYALYSILSRDNYVEILDYDRKSELSTFSIKRTILNFTLKKILSRIQSITKIKKKKEIAIKNVDLNIRNEKFEIFRHQYAKLTKVIVRSQLKTITKQYDYFICGSDQIWNPDYNIPSYFLDFCDENKRIIYGASLGKDNLTLHEKKIYRKYIKNIPFISVREESALEIVSRLTSKEVTMVLDPTLLVDSKDWEKVLIIPQFKNYIFCYLLNITKDKIEAVKRFGQKMNRKIVAIPFLNYEYEMYSEQFATYLMPDAGPREFLGLIYNADYIITDSYHATIFSLVFQKQFFVFERNEGGYDMNTRITTLLKYFNQEKRFIKPYELSLINLDDSNLGDLELIKEEKRKSLMYIYNALK